MISPPEAPSRRPTPLVAWVALLFVAFVVIAAQRARTLDQVPNRDITLYSVIGHELLMGRQLYSDLWDHKPPMIYASYALAEKLTGLNDRQFYLLAVVLSCWIAAMVALCASRFGTAAAACALILWVVSWNSASLEGNEPNAELFMNALLTTAFAVLTFAPRFTTAPAAAFGVLIAITTLFKPYAVIYALVPCALLADRRWMIKRNLLAIPVAVALVWIPLVSYFAFTNRSAILVDTLWRFNQQYAGSLPENLLASVLPPLLPVAYLTLLPLVLLAIAGVIAQLRNGRLSAHPWLLLLAYLAVTHVSVALPGRFFPHYYQLWLPPLILAASWAVAGGPRLSLWVGAAAVLLLVLQVRDLRRGLDEWSRIANPVPQPALDARPLARALRSRMPDCEFGLNIGSEVGLYFYGQFRPATGLFYKNHINTVASLRDDLLNRLRSSDRYRPCFVAYFRQSLESDETLRPRVANLIDRLQLERDERLSTGLFEVYLRGKESPLATEPGTR